MPCARQQPLALLGADDANQLDRFGERPVGQGLLSFEAAGAGDDQTTADGLDDLQSDIDALAGVDATEEQKIVVLVGGKLEVIEIEIIGDDDIIPHLVAHRLNAALAEIGVHGLEYAEFCEAAVVFTAARVADAGFANDHVRVGVGDRLMIAAERTEEKIPRLLALLQGRDGLGVEGLRA
jgi:hypothetical protein